MRLLVTGAAGFIGFHVVGRLLERGDDVVGVDNLNDYYDPSLKYDRLKKLTVCRRFRFERMDIADQTATGYLFARNTFDRVIHLAAQAGVQHSHQHPLAYINANIVGFTNVLEGCRRAKVDHLVYASSSSVYGLNKRVPFDARDQANHPVSLYAATKKANEVIAHSYSHLHGLSTTGLRLFSVYGPWGRPDMVLFKFTKAILAGEPVPVFNRGDMRRDFTYIDDIAEAVVRICDRPAQPDKHWDPARPCASSSSAPYRLYNIGNHRTVELKELITLLEQSLGRTALQELLPMQPGDVHTTEADVSELINDIGFTPSTPIELGISRFVAWYHSYYRT